MPFVIHVGKRLQRTGQPATEWFKPETRDQEGWNQARSGSDTLRTNERNAGQDVIDVIRRPAYRGEYQE